MEGLGFRVEPGPRVRPARIYGLLRRWGSPPNPPTYAFVNGHQQKHNQCLSGPPPPSYLVSQKYVSETAKLRVLKGGKEVTVSVPLGSPRRLVPVHIAGRPPSYLIVAGLVFTPVCVPYLRSEYGKEYDFDAPVKILDKMMHCMADQPDQQIVVVSQVLATEINIGYEDIVNTQVRVVLWVRVS